ncbi:hypothetical protein [Nocardia sp. NPDC005366]|uniref:hypothetical protein n=1 Tax=Nocardia sp. NPDC005366 TaxID=3156878 RepID=UPI0033B8ABB4
MKSALWGEVALAWLAETPAACMTPVISPDAVAVSACTDSRSETSDARRSVHARANSAPAETPAADGLALLATLAAIIADIDRRSRPTGE